MFIKVLIFLSLCHVAFALFFPSSGSSGCGCCAPPPPPPACGCGCGGRKKREIGHVKGHMVHRDDQEWNNQCNSQEFSEIILKHLNMASLKSSREAIYKELNAAYPDSLFTVFCLKNSTSSYQANADRYCMEKIDDHSCYVFEF